MAEEEVESRRPGAQLGLGERGNCGCKGVRTCAICEGKADEGKAGAGHQAHVRDHSGEFCTGPVLWFCTDCWRTFNLSQARTEVAVAVKTCGDHSAASSSATGSSGLLRGVRVFRDFISEAEEESIAEFIDGNPWKLSQSGRKKQDYGPRPNFKKRRVKVGAYCGLPPFSRPLLERMTGDGKYGLRHYEAVEQCHLDYAPERGSAIDPHRDDAWLWGEQLVTVNLLSDSVLTFTLEAKDAGLLCEEIPGVNAEVPTPATRPPSHTADLRPCPTGHVASELTGADNLVASPEPAEQPCPSRKSNARMESAIDLCASQGYGGSRDPVQCLSSFQASTCTGTDTLLVDGDPLPTVAAAASASVSKLAHDHSARTGAMCTVHVPLPRRSLVVVEGEARHRWLHSVRRQHVQDRRIAITWRDLGPSFCAGGSEVDIGDQLRRLSKNFSGLQTT